MNRFIRFIRKSYSFVLFEVNKKNYGVSAYMTVISGAVPVAVRMFIPSYIGRPYSILPTLAVVSMVAFSFSGVSSPFASSYIFAVFEDAPLVFITIAIKTSLPVILVRPLVVIFLLLLAEASCGFIYGKLILALGDALADGESDPDGLADFEADLDALADGDRLPDGLADLDSDLDALADGLFEADGLPDAELEADGLSEPDGLSEVDAEALGLWLPLGESEPDGLRLPDGLADLDALADAEPEGLRLLDAEALGDCEPDGLADLDALALAEADPEADGLRDLLADAEGEADLLADLDADGLPDAEPDAISVSIG